MLVTDSKRLSPDETQGRDYALESLTLPAALSRAASLYGTKTSYTEGSSRSGRSLTWAELAGRSEQVGAGLVALGLRPGDRVAICAENSIDWIVAFHATVAAGASAVLVYFDLKAGEISEQAGRPASRFFFASRSVLRRLDASGFHAERVIVLGPGSEDRSGVLTLDDVAAAATTVDREQLKTCAPKPDDLAAIVYTSGTTGGPKGVMLSHRNLISGAQSAVAAFDLTSDDSALLVLPLHHSLAFMMSGIVPVLIGGKIVFENDLRRIRDRLPEHRPTIFFGVPALFELMYRSILARAESEGRLKQMQAWQRRVRFVKRITGVNIGPVVFRSVQKALGGRIRVLVSGAAALKSQTALDYFSLGLPLLQGCGVTEASSAIAVQRFSRWRFLFGQYYERHAGSVGQPLPGVEVSLIDVPDKNINVATQGQGELVVRGRNVFMGYWDAPEATSSAMVDGWLRTGDLARQDKEGNVYLIGRSKYIIVLDSGEKVYPEELEANLDESELIQDVCVTGRGSRDKTVITAVVFPNVEAVLARMRADGFAPEARTVEKLIGGEIERLGKALAAYKRVARIELSDLPLPKSAAGKVARGRLADSYTFDYEKWVSSAESG